MDVRHGDCLDVMRQLDEASVHAVVTDPPYGLGFMGKAWDALPPGVEWAEECLRVLKPGGHLLAFGGSRTWHRLACAVEDAGFEVRDSIAWLYGSGFPKSLDVSKAITATQTLGSSSRVSNRRAMTGDESPSTSFGSAGTERAMTTARSSPPPKANLTDEAREWEGWGTALKPAFEPVVVARKPLAGTVAGNVLEHGTGALHIDACRVDSGGVTASSARAGRGSGSAAAGVPMVGGVVSPAHAAGRWPANVVLDEHAAEALDAQSGHLHSAGHARPSGLANMADTYDASAYRMGADAPQHRYGDGGGASRFFYVAKAPKRERPTGDVVHPTVKPLTLMRWLVRLVTPPGGTVLDPFAGSGTTAEACLLEGFDCIAIEREADYLPLIRQRLARHPQSSFRFAEVG